ncbi:hypothetical protein SAMN02927916_1226 [Flavobacterium anhuiense]|uniref:Uncharacterized protein n=1 Tax=Flavobacterium anhuiense TaxID=459526 RepID=A0ABY0LG07_9FLAO|nr:hypothetical protein [Flavobacterium anhuiense]SCY13595.1 hypothetical protein SAMN02927916_1226 [Flavobacterium anhuiense]
MYLEDFRKNEFNKCAVIIPSTPPTVINMKYDIHCAHAYKFTVSCLRDLELSADSLNNGLDVVPAISMWYLSVSSFLETIFKILSLRIGGYVFQCDMTIEDKYFKVLNMLSVDDLDLQKKIYEKLSDFSLIYKNLHMDSDEGSELFFKTANFSSNTSFLNQVDVLQSMLICVEVFENFRFIFEGVDLMPNVGIVAKGGNPVFEKLSILQKNVIKPIVKDIFSKHKIETKLKFNESFKQLSICKIFQSGEILVMSKNIEDEKYKYRLNSLKTDIISYYHSNQMRKYQGREEFFSRNYQIKMQ